MMFIFKVGKADTGGWTVFHASANERLKKWQDNEHH